MPSKENANNATSASKPIVLDEALFMQIRLFSLFCKRNPSIPPSDMDALFRKCSIWDFIDEGYEGLHTEGDEAIYQEILDIFNSRGVEL